MGGVCGPGEERAGTEKNFTLYNILYIVYCIKRSGKLGKGMGGLRKRGGYKGGFDHPVPPSEVPPPSSSTSDEVKKNVSLLMTSN